MACGPDTACKTISYGLPLYINCGQPGAMAWKTQAWGRKFYNYCEGRGKGQNINQAFFLFRVFNINLITPRELNLAPVSRAERERQASCPLKVSSFLGEVREERQNGVLSSTLFCKRFLWQWCCWASPYQPPVVVRKTSVTSAWVSAEKL